MSRRAGRGDPDFGSDSFLDIVANLVGILIILIVLAGLRAAQAPVETQIADVEEEPAASSAVSTSLPEETAEEIEVTSVAENSTPSAPNPESDLGPPAVPADLAEGRLRALQLTVTELQARMNALPVDDAARNLRSIQAQLAEVSGGLQGLQQRLAVENVKRQRALIAASSVDSDYLRLRQRLVDVNRLLEEVGTAEQPVEELELRINPVGRRGTGKAVVFRIDGGRVILVPAHELFELAEDRERGNTDLTLRGKTQRGVVGPIDGVTLEYEFGIEMVPVINGRGNQSFAARPRLQGHLKTSLAARGDLLESALEEGGIVSRTMLSTARGTIVRLFVGTDSFEAGRKVSAYIRDLGHPVSSVPVEPGSDIPVVVGSRSDAIVQ